MSVPSVALSASSVEWNVIAAAISTFLVTAALTWQGFRRGKKTVEAGKSELTPIVGATLIESASMVKLADALTHNTRAIEAQTAALSIQTAELRRATDVEILRHRN